MRGEVYNVSADGERMNQIMAEWILDLLGKPRELIRPVEDRPGHDRRYSLRPRKSAASVGSRLFLWSKDCQIRLIGIEVKEAGGSGS